MIGLGYWKAVAFISAKLGSFAGPAGTFVGWVLGALSAGSLAMSVVDALYAGKGLKFGFTWRPTIDVQ